MFDIQMFADTVTNDNDLDIKFNFGDDDNRTISLPNARNDIDESEIIDLQTFVVTNKLLVGDKALADVTDIEWAAIINTNRIKLDLVNA